MYLAQRQGRGVKTIRPVELKKKKKNRRPRSILSFCAEFRCQVCVLRRIRCEGMNARSNVIYFSFAQTQNLVNLLPSIRRENFFNVNSRFFLFPFSTLLPPWLRGLFISVPQIPNDAPSLRCFFHSRRQIENRFEKVTNSSLATIIWRGKKIPTAKRRDKIIERKWPHSCNNWPNNAYVIIRFAVRHLRTYVRSQFKKRTRSSTPLHSVVYVSFLSYEQTFYTPATLLKLTILIRPIFVLAV